MVIRSDRTVGPSALKSLATASRAIRSHVSTDEVREITGQGKVVLGLNKALKSHMYLGNKPIILEQHRSETETSILQGVCSFMKEETV
jgi:hypothetical protein